jgi:hypothetical protein
MGMMRRSRNVAAFTWGKILARNGRKKYYKRKKGERI